MWLSELMCFWLLLLGTFLSEAAGVTSTEAGRRRGGFEKRRKRVQRGHCSYTFVLPELDACQGSNLHTNGHDRTAVVQRDLPPPADGDWSSQKLQQLQVTMENNTQWLQKLESSIQRSIRAGAAYIPALSVNNQTETMLDIGTRLLTRTAEQTRKLNVVEAQVQNHTSRIEIQLLENSLLTHKLEKELLLQNSHISRLQEMNSHLEDKVKILESQQRSALEDLRQEKKRLQAVVRAQMEAITSLEEQLTVASSNNTILQSQHTQLMESVHTLIHMVTGGSSSLPRTHLWRDCADAYRAGQSSSGVYHVYISNRTEPVQVYCDMETSGGGWTVFQRRINGSVDFQRTWREYKMGFGDVWGEHWLGNEALYLMSSERLHSLRVEMRDWEGNSAHSLYERFTLASERQQYRLYLRGYSGTAGRQSSLTMHGSAFSTRDQDNDSCDHCKCAMMLTGGWWFDACGFSNLNGMYYSLGQNIRKLNGIKWHHFHGPSYSLRATTMMVRPHDF
ncbi:angiopoietin-4 [Synchiropus picturatus]